MKIKSLFLVSFILLLLFLEIFSVSSLAQKNTAEIKVSYFQASNSIKNSEKIVDDITNMGLNNQRFKDLLQDSRTYFELKDYINVLRIEKELKELKQKTLFLIETINKTQKLIENAESMGLNIESIHEQYLAGIEEFNENNFEQSLLLIKNSLSDVNKELNSLFNLEPVFENLEVLAKDAELKFNIINDLKDKFEKISVEDDLYSKIIIKEEILLLNTSITNLLRAKEEIQEISGKGVPVSRLYDLYEESIASIELGRFNEAIGLIEEIGLLKKEIFYLLDKIGQAKKEIGILKSKNLDFSSPQELLNQGIKKFEDNNYEDSKILIDESIAKSNELKSSSLLFGVLDKSSATFNLLHFLKNYWLIILLSFVALFIIFSFSYKSLSGRHLARQILLLKKQEKTIIELIKKYQTEYFKHRKISKESYNLAIDKYQERLLKIKEKLPLLESKLEQQRAKIKKHK